MSEKKKCCWVKRVLLTLAVILGLVVVLLLALPLWIGPVVTGTANSVVPGVTKTGFHLGEFELNPYTGKVHLGDLQLQNPERFFVKKEAEKSDGVLGAVTGAIGSAVDAAGNALVSHATNALSLTAVNVSLSTGSLLSDTIRIEEIVVRDLSIYGDLTFSNIREIVAHAAGDADGKDAKEEPKVEEPKTEAETAEEEASAKKVVIGRILIAGTKIQWGHLVVPLPDIEIKDIGKDEDVSEEGAIEQVLDSICAAADKAKMGLGTALKAAIDGGKAVAKGVGAAVDLVSDGVSVVADGVGKTAELVTEGVGKTATAVTDAATATVSTVADGVGKTAGAVTEGVGKAAEAVSEKAGAGVNAVKGLFK